MPNARRRDPATGSRGRKIQEGRRLQIYQGNRSRITKGCKSQDPVKSQGRISGSGRKSQNRLGRKAAQWSGRRKVKEAQRTSFAL